MNPPEEPLSREEANAGLLFALTAERLAAFYEHHAWLTLSQGATLAADWLARSKSHLSMPQRKHLSELSDRLARQIAASVSREAGLHISYEMTEALDQRYVSETGDLPGVNYLDRFASIILAGGSEACWV